MPVSILQIEAALDDIIRHEEGPRFQRIATILAKQKRPDLIACEHKKDLGADAISPEAVALDGRGKVLACSITATLSKVTGDAKKICKNFGGVRTIIFASLNKVSNQTWQKWAEELKAECSIDLVVMPREEIVSSLLDPVNASLCRTLLRIPVTLDHDAADVLGSVREAASELQAAWSRRLEGKPLLDLRAVRVDRRDEWVGPGLHLKDIDDLLLQCQRVVLEAPAGRGKTTTLIQLAHAHAAESAVGLLVDMPGWIDSRCDVLTFIAGMVPFKARSLDESALAQLRERVHFSFLLNGWNEVGDSNTTAALHALRALERDFPSAGIIVATRAHHVPPPLPGASRLRLLPLSRAERAEYVTKRFAQPGGEGVSGNSDELRSKLDTEPVLDDLTRTPLFLASVADIFESGEPIPNTKLGVIRAVMDLVEASEEHGGQLKGQPLQGHARNHLAQLATSMTAAGQVVIAEWEARTIVTLTASRLQQEAQIASIPEPLAVLTSLCAHHVLERQDYPTVTFRFEHQRFQEFFAALELELLLQRCVEDSSDGALHGFLRWYVNVPAWAEPLRMAAEDLGARGREQADAIEPAVCLVESALRVDPMFAAELFRVSAPAVQARIGRAVEERLRAWHSEGGAHRECAQAAMLATGSDAFGDILLPLLAHGDRNIRLGLVEHGIELSSLGNQWQEVVRNWIEDARADFLSTLIRQRGGHDAVLAFVLADPSLQVRKAAISEFTWVGSPEEVAKLLSDLDHETFTAVVQGLSTEMIPDSVRPRARAMYLELVDESTDTLDRVKWLVRAAEMGNDSVAAKLKAELNSVERTRLRSSGGYDIESALRLLEKKDAVWASHWVAERVADGTLWRDDWLKFIRRVPEKLRDSILQRLEDEEVSHAILAGSVSLLAAASDPLLARRVFERLCAGRRTIREATAPPNPLELTVRRQLTELWRALPVNVVVSGLADHLGRSVDEVELWVISEPFGTRPPNDQLRSELENTTREQLRRYLRSAVPVVLEAGDDRGALMAQVATALAEVGNPSDMDELRRLIVADIDRANTKRVPVTWSGWHVQALVRLDPASADRVLLELLDEAAYEREAASALASLARTRTVERTLRFGDKKDFNSIWDARAGERSSDYDEARRERYASAIRQRLEAILDGGTATQRDWRDLRARELAAILASVDSQRCAELVMEVASRPGNWGAWTRTDSLESLLFGGATLPAGMTLTVIDAICDEVRSHHHETQYRFLVQRVLCILPFVDPPETGFEALRRLVVEFGVRGHELRDVIAAVGCSRSSEAVEFTRECIEKEPCLRDVWESCVRALGEIDDDASRELLLGLVDREELDWSRLDVDVLARELAKLARQDATVRQRVLDRCGGELASWQRELLAKIVTGLQDNDADLAALNLIDDRETSPVPWAIRDRLDHIFVERQPYQDSPNMYTLAPRSANAIRTRLFEMAASDERRKRSAFELLGQIELWRLKYGKSPSEPRHPALDSGVPWPVMTPGG